MSLHEIHVGELAPYDHRCDGSFEFKHQNISAVLKGLCGAWIAGYDLMFSFQTRLIDAVARWLAVIPTGRNVLSHLGHYGLAEAAQLWVGPASTLTKQPPPDELEQMLHIAKNFDVAARDEPNRALRKAGEQFALKHEAAG